MLSWIGQHIVQILVIAAAIWFGPGLVRRLAHRADSDLETGFCNKCGWKGKVAKGKRTCGRCGSAKLTLRTS